MPAAFISNTFGTNLSHPSLSYSIPSFSQRIARYSSKPSKDKVPAGFESFTKIPPSSSANSKPPRETDEDDSTGDKKTETKRREEDTEVEETKQEKPRSRSSSSRESEEDPEPERGSQRKKRGTYS
jgi:hypothetical protein